MMAFLLYPLQEVAYGQNVIAVLSQKNPFDTIKRTIQQYNF